MQIKDLKPGMTDITITGKVASVGSPRQIQTRFGSTTTLTEVRLQDDSGSVRLPLWGQASEGIEEGQTIELQGAFTKEFRGEVELGIGRGGKVRVVE